MKKTPLISTLEPRLLFDGAAVATAIDVLDNSSFNSDSFDTIETAAVEKSQLEKKEIVFIDSNVKDYESLKDSFSQNYEVYIIDDSSSGIDQIAFFLEGKTNIDAIHIFSHGKIAEINLGNGSINGDNINSFNQDLKLIGESLSTNGDILLYGCSISQNQEGKEFIDSFAQLTNADILASDDITGDKSLGGDWNLEYNAGNIESQTIIADNYNATFANSDPVIIPGVVTGTITEGSGSLSANGSIDFTDAEPAAVNDGPFSVAAINSITAVDINGNPITLSAQQITDLGSGFIISAGSVLTNNGTINWDYDVNESDLNFLGAGDVLTAVFTITVDDKSGGIATQDITITINGVNDPLSVNSGNVVGNIVEGDTNLTSSGSISFTDVDLSDRPIGNKSTNSITAVDINGNPLILTAQQISDIEAAFSIDNLLSNTNDGTINWTFTTTENNLNFLGKDEVLTAIFTITVTDGNGSNATEDVTITITGETETPVITPGNITGNITEGSGSLSANGSIDFTDSDTADRPSTSVPAYSFSAVDINGNPLTLTAQQELDLLSGFIISAGGPLTNNGTINWDYNITEDKLDFLGTGDKVTAIFTLSVNDQEGGIATQDVTITITGANDSVSINGGNVIGNITEGDSNLSSTGTVTFTDIDLSDRPTGTVSSTSISGFKQDGITALNFTAQQISDIQNAFSIDNLLSNTSDGTINWSYITDDAKIGFLQKGEVITAVFTITVSDLEGSTDTQEVTITITGANEAPVITAGVVTGNITEGSGALNENGNITFIDADVGDSPTATSSFTSISALDKNSNPFSLTAQQLADIKAGFSINNVAGNTNSGTINWDFSLNENQLDFLAQGEVVTVVFTITVDDQIGGTDTQEVTITITGSNDSVNIVGGDVSGDITESGALNDSGSIIFVDVDASDSIQGNVTNSSLVALDKNSNPLTLTAQQILDIQNAFTLANANNGAIAWDYTISESQLDFLGKGEVVTATFTVTLTDNNGSTINQDVTITINGANELPFITPGNVDSSITEGSGALSDSGTITFIDADLNDRPEGSGSLNTMTLVDINGNPLTLTAQQIADIQAGFTVSNVGGNTNSGTINWDYSITEDKIDFLAQGEVLTATFTISVDDQDGGVSTQDVTITITGANDSVSIVGGNINASVVESGNLIDSGSILFTDKDYSNRPQGSLANNTISAIDKDGNSFSLTAQQILDIQNAFSIANANNGAIDWTYSITEAQLDFLGNGEIITATFIVTVTDEAGSIDTQNMQVTITGTNDVPDIQVIYVLADITEGSGSLSDNGSITFTDVDLSDNTLASSSLDSITLVDINGNPLSLSTQQIANIQAGFSVENVIGNSNNGTINWDYIISENNLDFLANGEVITVVFKINLDDQSGGVVSQDVIVTITGTNDIALVSADNIDVKLSFSESYEQNVSSLFTDVDSTDSFKYEITGLPEGLSFNPITGEISGNPTETGIFEIIIKAINTKDEQDIVDKTYKIEVLPANTSEAETAKEEISETIEQEAPSKVELNKFVSNDVQGVLDSSSNEVSDFDLGKGFIQYNLTPNSSNITDNIQTDISGNIAIRINDEGKVEFSDTVADTFDEIGLSIEVMSRIDNYIEMKVTDVQLGQRYEIYLSDGSPLPKGITFDEKTGLLKGNLIDGLEITIKAISESGVIRTLNVKIDINDKDESEKTSEQASLGLQEQIEQKASSMQDYGNKISSLFSDQLV